MNPYAYRWCFALLAVVVVATAGCARELPAVPQQKPLPAPAAAVTPAPAPPPAATQAVAEPATTHRRANVSPAPPPPQKPLALDLSLDLPLQQDETHSLYDDSFNRRGHVDPVQEPLQGVFSGKVKPRQRRFSISGDLFWDEEMLKQEQVNYLDAIKGGEISVEIKTR